MDWTVLWNPLKSLKSTTILLIGLLFFVLGNLAAAYFDFVFNGVLDIHQVGGRELWYAFKENAVIVALLAVMLYGLGYAINRKTRLIDILNAVLVFRIPFYVVVLWSSLPFFTDLLANIEDNKDNLVNLHFEILQLVGLLVFALFILLLLIYAILLLFNGFKTATNAKKWQHFLLFGVVLFIAEVISKILL